MKKKVTINLTEAEIKKCKEDAKKENRSFSQQIGWLIMKYVPIIIVVLLISCNSKKEISNELFLILPAQRLIINGDTALSYSTSNAYYMTVDSSLIWIDTSSVVNYKEIVNNYNIKKDSTTIIIDGKEYASNNGGRVLFTNKVDGKKQQKRVFEYLRKKFDL